ncbi:MAG: hypothetical protein IKJ32_03835 [Clostridia bacterium]|nr:hypothetical protein [Clostridia bacterium]
MDDNLFEAIQMSVWVFLFIFALSFAFIQYNRINDVIDLFVEANMFGSREDFVGVFLDESEIARNTHRAEVVLSVLNIPDTVSETGNSSYKVKIKAGGNETVFEYYEELDAGYVVRQGVKSTGSLSKTYYLRGDIPVGGGINDLEDLINDLTNPVYGYAPSAANQYSVKYDDDGIYYTRK